MNSLFKVTRQQTPIHEAKDGQHFGSDEAARRHNAEIAMLRALKRPRDEGPRDVTFVRNVTGYMPVSDIVALRDMLKGHVETVKPQFLAIEGKVGWVREEGRQVRYPIELPWQDTSDNRLDASLRTLRALIQWMAADVIQPYAHVEQAVAEIIRDHGLPARRLSRLAVHVLCNVRHLVDQPELAKRDLTPYQLDRGFKQHMDERDRSGNPKPKQEERLLAAFEAALVALETPVPAR